MEHASESQKRIGLVLSIIFLVMLWAGVASSVVVDPLTLGNRPDVNPSPWNSRPDLYPSHFVGAAINHWTNPIYISLWEGRESKHFLGCTEFNPCSVEQNVAVWAEVGAYYTRIDFVLWQSRPLTTFVSEPLWGYSWSLIGSRDAFECDECPFTWVYRGEMFRDVLGNPPSLDPSDKLKVNVETTQGLRTLDDFPGDFNVMKNFLQFPLLGQAGEWWENDRQWMQVFGMLDLTIRQGDFSLLEMYSDLLNKHPDTGPRWTNWKAFIEWVQLTNISPQPAYAMDMPGNITTFDKDGDGWYDIVEMFHGSDWASLYWTPSDNDGDGILDVHDVDIDGDGEMNWIDLDDDGDGHVDILDTYPHVDYDKVNCGFCGPPGQEEVLIFTQTFRDVNIDNGITFDVKGGMLGEQYDDQYHLQSMLPGEPDLDEPASMQWNSQGVINNLEIPHTEVYVEPSFNPDAVSYRGKDTDYFALIDPSSGEFYGIDRKIPGMDGYAGESVSDPGDGAYGATGADNAFNVDLTFTAAEDAIHDDRAAFIADTTAGVGAAMGFVGQNDVLRFEELMTTSLETAHANGWISDSLNATEMSDAVTNSLNSVIAAGRMPTAAEIANAIAAALIPSLGDSGPSATEIANALTGAMGVNLTPGDLDSAFDADRIADFDALDARLAPTGWVEGDSFVTGGADLTVGNSGFSSWNTFMQGAGFSWANFLTGTSQAPMTIFYDFDIPGHGIWRAEISTSPDTSTVLGSTLDGMRIAFRSFLMILVMLVFSKSVVRTLVFT